MVIYFWILLPAAVTAAYGIALRPLFRRAISSGAAGPAPAPPPVELVPELPPELEHLPEPPVLEAATVLILEPAEITKRLRQLELGVQELGPPLLHDDPVVATALAAIGDPATQRRYTPRRPNLLPQLMRAINDEEVSRRELSAIIARDPAMVGSLLKMANSAYYRVASG